MGTCVLTIGNRLSAKERAVLPGFAPSKAAPVTMLFALVAITVSWPDASAAQSVRYRIVPEESEVRYKVRERIARLNFPTDAVGATREITGAIVLDAWVSNKKRRDLALNGRLCVMSSQKRNLYLMMSGTVMNAIPPGLSTRRISCAIRSG